MKTSVFLDSYPFCRGLVDSFTCAKYTFIPEIEHRSTSKTTITENVEIVTYRHNVLNAGFQKKVSNSGTFESLQVSVPAQNFSNFFLVKIECD